MARSLAQEIREARERAYRRTEPMWWVDVRPCAARLLVEGSDEDTALVRSLMACRRGWRYLPTDTPGVRCVEPDAPVGVLAVPESFMPGLMGVLRRNGCHGTYRQAGTEREYRF